MRRLAREVEQLKMKLALGGRRDRVNRGRRRPGRVRRQADRATGRRPREERAARPVGLAPRSARQRGRRDRVGQRRQGLARRLRDQGPDRPRSRRVAWSRSSRPSSAAAAGVDRTSLKRAARTPLASPNCSRPLRGYSHLTFKTDSGQFSFCTLRPRNPCKSLIPVRHPACLAPGVGVRANLAYCKTF